jgi:hypothetical protein
MRKRMRSLGASAEASECLSSDQQTAKDLFEGRSRHPNESASLAVVPRLKSKELLPRGKGCKHTTCADGQDLVADLDYLSGKLTLRDVVMGSRMVAVNTARTQNLVLPTSQRLPRYALVTTTQHQWRDSGIAKLDNNAQIDLESFQERTRSLRNGGHRRPQVQLTLQIRVRQQTLQSIGRPLQLSG